MRWLLGWMLWAGLALGLAACGASAEVLDRELRSSVFVTDGSGGHGSGVIVSGRTVLTNAHVAKMLKAKAVVRFHGGEEVVGRVAWVSEVSDVALIDVEVPAGYAPAVVSCERPAAGGEIVTVGHPVITRWAVSYGRVSSDLPPDYPQLIEWDAVVLDVSAGPGSSGSPVFDKYGRVIGLVFGQLVAGDMFSRVPVEYTLMVPMSEICWQMGLSV
jgi:S1-C subfamily serine protease